MIEFDCEKAHRPRNKMYSVKHYALDNIDALLAVGPLNDDDVKII